MKNIRLDYGYCNDDCSTCESCIYDDPQLSNFTKNPIIPTTTNVYKSIKKEEKLYCNGCRFVSKLKYQEDTRFSNWFCDKTIIPVYGKGRMIAGHIKTEKLVEKPIWCPLLKENKGNMGFITDLFKKKEKKFSELTSWEQAKAWKDLKPLNTYDKIEVGKWYHIPPVNKQRRRDVFVIDKFPAMLRCRLKGYSEYDTTHLVYISKGDAEVHFMHEIENPEKTLKD